MKPATRAQIVDGIEARGVVAIIRIADGSMLQSVASALIDGGVTTIEVTMTVPGAIELIAGLAGTLPAGVTLGAGTVLDAATALASAELVPPVALSRRDSGDCSCAASSFWSVA